MGVFFIRVPYYTGDLKRDPNLENYPHVHIECRRNALAAFTSARMPARLAVTFQARQKLGSFLNLGSLLRVLFIRVRYYIGDPQRDHNYPHVA